jgi:uncharacterized protein (TIGR00251 family)
VIALRAVTGGGKGASGVMLPVYAQPGARQEKCVGEHDGCLKLAVTAPPEDGAANTALIDLVARTLGVRRSQVQLTAGASQRRKQFFVEGLSVDEVAGLIEALLG